MGRSLICLTLTCNTIAADLELVNRYRSYIDLVELRVDYLDEDERFHIRSFPQQAHIPSILTIRRKIDGGRYEGGEASRTMLFARGLAFADQNPAKNFAYVDFEDDFRIPSLQEGALAFGTRIIRSYHNMSAPVTNLAERLRAMRVTGYEIPKIAFMPHSLSDVTNLFREAADLTGADHILCAMGPEGLPSRILCDKLNSYLTYTTAPENMQNTKSLGHIDPVTLCNTYHFRELNKDTAVYGITGYPLEVTSSPLLHNKGYQKHHMNAVFIPVRSKAIEEMMEFAEQVGIKGFAVTVPHKQAVLQYLQEISARVGDIGACNTVVRRGSCWYGYNTDAGGIKKALAEFLGLEKLHRKKVAIIGAGGASRAIAYVVKMMGGKACIFNRTISKAKMLAEDFGFKYAPLIPESAPLLEEYSFLIIQTTSKGMESSLPPNENNDPLWFYEFNGTENLFDIIYAPEVTPVMSRAAAAGCRVSNGFPMLKYQGYEQFKLFTGVDYESTDAE
ncbi:MAG: type I 3-dehydroquinate dehydratase [Treponema sp.]|nr:type I 3-dehydroquinate dehydratase [Treponema sp.]